MSAGSKPPALTVERLQELRKGAELAISWNEEPIDAPLSDVRLDPEEVLALLAMAERSVSEDTVRKLADSFQHADDAFEARQAENWHDARASNDSAHDAMAAFQEMAKRDLRAAATRLRQGGDGNG